MTQIEANLLFSKYDFATAKSMLIDEAHRNGIEIDEMNASIFELMAAACNGCGSIQNQSQTNNANIIKLVCAINDKQFSVKEMLVEMGLKDRESFLNLYLSPAIGEGFVRMLYPDSPRHPRQKYLLTARGLAFVNELKNEAK